MGQFTPEDEELLRRIRAGDADAAAAFVGRHEAAIRRAVRVRRSVGTVRRGVGTSDVIQSIHVRLIEAVRRDAELPDDPARLVQWLVRVARNRHVDHCRRAGRVRDVPPEHFNGQPAGGPGPGSDVARREEAAEVLSRLPPWERDVARRRAEGETWEQIAAAVGGTPEAVRKRFERATKDQFDAPNSPDAGG